MQHWWFAGYRGIELLPAGVVGHLAFASDRDKMPADLNAAPPGCWGELRVHCELTSRLFASLGAAMLYIGFFRYEFEDSELGQAEGRFTYAIEAEDVDTACQAMAAKIPEHYGELLRNTAKLFLDDVVEIKALPEGGTILRAEHGPLHIDDPLYMVALPFHDGDGCANYRQGPDPEVDLEAANQYEQQPFIEFDEPGELDVEQN